MSQVHFIGSQELPQRRSKRHVAGSLLRKLFYVPMPVEAPESTSELYVAHHASPRMVPMPSPLPEELLQSSQSCPAEIQMSGFDDDDDDFENNSDKETSVPSTECGTHSDVEDIEASPDTAETGLTSSYASDGADDIAIFGSTATDFDFLMCPGAQAERDAEYIQKVCNLSAAPPPYGPGAWFAVPSCGPGMPLDYSAAYGHVMQLPVAQPSMGGLDVAGLEAAAQAARLEATRLDAAAAQLRSKAPVQAGTDALVNAQNLREAQASEVALHDPNDPTTVMIRNLPNDYNREMLSELLDEEGFRGRYDFIYLPLDLKRMSGLGYAFVNMLDFRDAKLAIDRLNGFTRWTKMSKKICEVTWGEPVQGLDENVERYRNCPIMHPDVPDEAKPVLFNMGVRVPFPPPTKKLRAPRIFKQ